MNAILDAMKRVDSATATGAPLTLRTLRAALPGVGPEAFNATVLGAARDGLVCLHRHDQPARETQAERDAMIPDGSGGYYFTISRRMN